MSSSKSEPQGPKIAIIGGGVGGLSFAIALKRQLGYENFTIYEKGSDIGGTWRANTYPGCSSDIHIHFYTLSTDLYPAWNKYYGMQPEIQAYLKNLVDKYSLSRHIELYSEIISAEWDSSDQLYHLSIQDVHLGAKRCATAQVVISAVGYLDVPGYPPDIPGISRFKGHLFHSARWNHAVDLKNKKVAVIGNGASAVQFLPIIAEDETVQVTNFCRTPNWLSPRPNLPYSSVTKWLFTHFPPLMRLYRNLLFLRSELFFFTAFYSTRLRGLVTESLKEYILKNAPPEYRDKLVPQYPVGCKRILVDTNYLSALHRPNVTMNWDGILEITEDGIKTKKDENIPFDVIIAATGFENDEYPFCVRGTRGQTINEYYDTKNGPEAYIGTTLPGFPNFFTVLGPNTITGYTSVIFFEEVQINYIIQFVKPILSGLVSSFEVTAEAANEYNIMLRRRMSQSAFPNCHSWYRVGGDGKVSGIFPGYATMFWWWMRRPVWYHYKIVSARPWPLQARRGIRRRSVFGLASLGIFLVWLLYGKSSWAYLRSLVWGR